jgi:NADPH2:quinone reductase
MQMKAVQLTATEGFGSLRFVEVERPRPAANEVLIEVKATGLNFAEVEQTRGRYPLHGALPLVMGFEAAGIVVELGSEVTSLSLGQRVAAFVSSGGFAQYATADAAGTFPIPGAVSFAEATSIVVQGLSAYALLKLAAKPQPSDTVLIQSAAGGVGLFLVQLAKIMGVKQVIALASSDDKLAFVKTLGADVAINYSNPDWPAKVLEATNGRRVDLVLEASSGDIGRESFKLLAPFGREIMYGAQNMFDTLSSEQVTQLIRKQQSLTGFNITSTPRHQLAACLAELLPLIADGKLKLHVGASFPLADFASAFEALAGRHTIGKVVMVP